MRDDDPCVCGREDCPLENNDPVVTTVTLKVEITHGYGDLIPAHEIADAVERIVGDHIMEEAIESIEDDEVQEKAWDRNTSNERIRVSVQKSVNIV